MTNFFFTSYRVAIEKSIFNEAMRRLKIQLALFNSYYRVAKRLLMIVQGDELVDENNNDASDNDETEDEKNENEKDEDEMEDKMT